MFRMGKSNIPHHNNKTICPSPVTIPATSMSGLHKHYPDIRACELAMLAQKLGG